MFVEKTEMFSPPTPEGSHIGRKKCIHVHSDPEGVNVV